VLKLLTPRPQRFDDRPLLATLMATLMNGCFSQFKRDRYSRYRHDQIEAATVMVEFRIQDDCDESLF